MNIDPDILTSDNSLLEDINDEEIDQILADSVADQEPADENSETMAGEEFDVANGTDGEKALDKLASVHCAFNKNDIQFWFCQLEGQLELRDVQSQWLKRMALLACLPVEIQEDVRDLLMLKSPGRHRHLQTTQD